MRRKLTNSAKRSKNANSSDSNKLSNNNSRRVNRKLNEDNNDSKTKRSQLNGSSASLSNGEGLRETKESKRNSSASLSNNRESLREARHSNVKPGRTRSFSSSGGLSEGNRISRLPHSNSSVNSRAVVNGPTMTGGRRAISNGRDVNGMNSSSDSAWSGIDSNNNSNSDSTGSVDSYSSASDA